MGSSGYFKPESQKSLSSCHKELDRHILHIDISLQEYLKKKPKKQPEYIYLRGKLAVTISNCFYPNWNILKSYVYMHLYSGLNYRFAAGTCNNACFILWTAGSVCRLFTDVFFHCQPLNYYRCTRKDRSDNLWKLDQCMGLTAFLTSL